MLGIPTLKNWPAIVAGVNRYVDTTATGANTGLSKADAWTSIESAILDSTNSRIVAIRRAQAHTLTANQSTAGAGSLSAPLRFIGDNDTLEIWSEDSGDTRPTITINGYYIQAHFTGRCLHFANLHFIGSSDGTALSNRSCCVYVQNVRFELCKAIGATGQEGMWYVVDCDFDISVTTHANFQPPATAFITRSTFDGGKYGLYTPCNAYIEDSAFGATTAHSTSDICMGGYGSQGVIRGRNVVLASATEITKGYSAIYIYLPIPSLQFFEDYDGSKGAWFCMNLTGAESGSDTITLIPASSTPAGQRSGGSVNVLSVIKQTSSAQLWALPVALFPMNVSAGSHTVDVWTQPSGWATVPDVTGIDANLWVEVQAWDTATSRYLSFDSRDEASQDAHVNNEWHKIRVTGVEADLAGTIIIRVYQTYGDGTDILYVDRKTDVT